jgi:hypothetical protein
MSMKHQLWRVGVLLCAVVIAKSLLSTPAQAQTVTVTPTTVAPSTAVTVVVANGPANPKDWVGMVAVGAPNVQGSILQWMYLNGQGTAPPTGMSDATLGFTAPATTGSYEFRLYINDTFTVAATSNTLTVSTGGGGGGTFYISPTGSNANDGSSGSPWLTFAFAISQLDPGETLILKNGTYTRPVTGTPVFTNKNGTAGSLITIKAENERQAWIQDDGSNAALNISSSSYLVFEGLRLSSVDASATPSWGEPLYVHGSHHITFRRLLLHNNNRYCNCQLFDGQLSNNFLLEENEFYYFHRHAIGFSSIDDSIIRRNYCHSRAHADIGGGYGSGIPGRGDACITVYPGSRNIIENTISEANLYLSEINASAINENNTFLGSISLDETYGAQPNSRGATASQMPLNTHFTNFIAINPFYVGFLARGARNARCDNCTILNPGSSGITTDSNGGVSDGSQTFFSNNTLVANSAGTGFDIQQQASFALDYPNAYNNVTNFNPAATHASITNERTLDPQLGTCRVFIPASSPMKGAGLGGADIGANVLYRYESGVLTAMPLWDPVTSRFPCGATAAGLNDTAGNSCINVHERLNVNTNGCFLPGVATARKKGGILSLQ